jgi:effector-binding domain-containing protein
MSIQYVDHHQIDPTKWDSAILRSPHPLAYGLFEYLNAVCESQWDALIYNDYEAVFPLPFKKKFGIKYLVQPVFCQQLGAFGSNVNVSTHHFLSAIPKRFLRVRLQLNPYFDQTNEIESIQTKPAGIIASSRKLTTKTNMTIQLSQPLDYNKDCKKNLHRLAELPIEYKINAISIRDAIDTYRKAWGKQNPEIEDEHYQLFANACTDKLSFTVTAHHQKEGDLLGAAIFLITPENTKRSLHYVCAGPTEAGKSIGVMHGIIDFILNRYKGENMLFDFEGSSIASVASFYKKFGANEEPFFCFNRGF